MRLTRLVLRNLSRHRLRLSLTVLGIAIAVTAMGFMRTVLTAWNAGVEQASARRLITQHAVSFIFPLPLAYRERILRVPGVERVTFANWFGGVYVDPKEFFPRLAIDPETYFSVYPEYVPNDTAAIARLRQTRNGCIAGEKLAAQYHWRVGDKIVMEGDIYPGHWEFELVGTYHGRDATTDTRALFFNWNYLNQTLEQTVPVRAGRVGWYVIEVAGGADVPAVSAAVDREFANSDAETKTETERDFERGFVSMSGAIISVISLVSYVIIGIVFLVLGNTMIMTARERVREYALLKALGFSGRHLAVVIGGESLLVAALGGGLGLLLTLPICAGVAAALPTFFPVFSIAPQTVAFALGAALAAGVAASLVPVGRTLRMRIVDGLHSLN